MGTKYKGTDKERLALDTYIKLQRAAETALNRTSRLLAELGLSVSQFGVLEALYHLGCLSQRDLAEKLLKSTANMTSVLKLMEKRGLIQRQRSELDNRYIDVDLTEEGRALIAGYFPRHVALMVEEMAALTEDEQAQLSQLCRKLGLREKVEPHEQDT